MTGPKIVWDEVGKRTYKSGVDHCVLYVMDNVGAYPSGVAWNGITTITEKPTGGDANAKWADNQKYLNLISREEFAGSIEAFMCPVEFYACDGLVEPSLGVSFAQQGRKQFGLCYRTSLGNDILGVDYGYQLHIVYGATATPSEKANATMSDSPDAIALSWDFTTTPVAVAGYKPTSHIVIDSTTVDPADLAALEVILYGVSGSPGTAARLPLPTEMLTLMAV